MDAPVALLVSVCVFVLSLFTIDPLLWSPGDDVAAIIGTNFVVSVLAVMLLFLWRRGKPELPRLVSIPAAVLLMILLVAMIAWIFVWIQIADAFHHFEL